jgi:L-Ala-D/L-Glu epimerase
MFWVVSHRPRADSPPALKVLQHLYWLELREPFGIASSTYSRSDTVIVNIGGGWGEAVSSTRFGENECAVMDMLARIAEMDLPPADQVEDVADALAARIAGFGAAKAAVDIALHDCIAKRLGVPLHKLLGRAVPDGMLTSFTIGIAPMDEMLRKVDEARPFRILKVKLGRDVGQDIEVMRAIRRAVGEKPLRVDANCGWSLADARRALPALADLGVEYVEQPLARGALEELRELHHRAPLPIYADEDAVTATDVPGLAGIVDGVNIKLMKCGGIAPARRMISAARAHGMKVMLGGRIESSIGMTAAAHLAPWADSLDLDSSLLVSNDPFRGLACDAEGCLHLPDAPGLGVEPTDSFRAEFGAV